MRPIGVWNAHEWVFFIVILCTICMSVCLPDGLLNYWDRKLLLATPAVIGFVAIRARALLRRVKLGRLATPPAPDPSVLVQNFDRLILDAPTSRLSKLLFGCRDFSQSECEHNTMLLRALRMRAPIESRRRLDTIIATFENGVRDGGASLSFQNYCEIHRAILALLRETNVTK